LTRDAHEQDRWSWAHGRDVLVAQTTFATIGVGRGVPINRPPNAAPTGISAPSCGAGPRRGCASDRQRADLVPMRISPVSSAWFRWPAASPVPLASRCDQCGRHRLDQSGRVVDGDKRLVRRMRTRADPAAPRRTPRPTSAPLR